MITWDAVLVAAGYNFEEFKGHRYIDTYYALKDGEVREFVSGAAAKEFSQLVEFVRKKTEEFEKYETQNRIATATAGNFWINALRAEFAELNDETYNLCYAAAYDRGHPYGYDEVAQHMDEIVGFALKIIKSVQVVTDGEE